MILLLYITISLFWGWITARFAQKKGLDPRKWYIAGAFFCALAFVVLLFQRKRTANPSIPTYQTELHPIYTSHKQNVWYYLNEKGQQLGPLSFQSLTKAWEEKKIQEETCVWNEDLDNWKKFTEVLQVTTPKS